MRLIHGTPITPKRHLAQLEGESFCVSYAYPEQLHDVGPIVPESGILLLDNGAFTAWKQGREFDEAGFWLLISYQALSTGLHLRFASCRS